MCTRTQRIKKLVDDMRYQREESNLLFLPKYESTKLVDPEDREIAINGKNLLFKTNISDGK